MIPWPVLTITMMMALLVVLWPGRFPWRVAMIGADLVPGRARSEVRGWSSSGGRQEGTTPHTERVTDAGLAMCADLLAVALTAGCSISEALVSLGEFDGPGGSLGPTAAELRRGVSLTDALDRLPRRYGRRWQQLATILALGSSSGAPIADSLRRLAAGERLRERRLREQRIRRLPVLLLLPLTTLVLPAFVLVTFVPMAVVTAATLHLS